MRWIGRHRNVEFGDPISSRFFGEVGGCTACFLFGRTLRRAGNGLLGAGRRRTDIGRPSSQSRSHHQPNRRWRHQEPGCGGTYNLFIMLSMSFSGLSAVVVRRGLMEADSSPKGIGDRGKERALARKTSAGVSLGDASPPRRGRPHLHTPQEMKCQRYRRTASLSAATLSRARERRHGMAHRYCGLVWVESYSSFRE